MLNVISPFVNQETDKFMFLYGSDLKNTIVRGKPRIEREPKLKCLLSA